MALSIVLWDEGLADEIYQVLRDKEHRLPVYYAQSPELHLRRQLVDWLASIWDKYNFCHMTRHLAICLLDFFMDRFSIEGRQIYLVAIGCLLVACKFEEQDVNIPRGSELNQFVEPPGFTKQEFFSVELTILDFFKWNINIPTAAHFTNYFIKTGRSCKDFSQPHMTSALVHQYVNYFLEISLQDHYYRDFLPSQVAAACVASTRIVGQAMPTWPSKLQEVSGYSLKDLRPLIEHLLKTHREDEAQQVAKSGMLTPPMTPQSKMGQHSTPHIHTADINMVQTAGIAPTMYATPNMAIPHSTAYAYAGAGDGNSFLVVVPVYSPASPTHEVITISDDDSPMDSEGYGSKDRDGVSMLTVMPST